MADKNKGSKQKGQRGGAAVDKWRFINVSLSRAEKDKLKEMDLPLEFPLSLITDLAGEGFKFSIREDEKSGGYMASLSDIRERSETHKCILTGRGSSPTNAWYSLAYKHLVVLQGDWLPEVGNAGMADFE